MSKQIFRKVLYLAIIALLIFIGAMIGILYQDKIIQRPVTTPTVTVTPAPSEALSPTPTVKPSPTVIPTPRPTDKIVDDKYKQYINTEGGIEFRYPKEWDLTESINTNGKNESGLWITMKSKTSDRFFVIAGDPLEYHIFGDVTKEENIAIDGHDGKLEVYLECDLDPVEKCPENISFENKNYKEGHIVITVKNIGGSKWIFDGPRWTPENPLTVDEAIRQAKELTSSVHFIKN